MRCCGQLPHRLFQVAGLATSSDCTRTAASAGSGLAARSGRGPQDAAAPRAAARNTRLKRAGFTLPPSATTRPPSENAGLVIDPSPYKSRAEPNPKAVLVGGYACPNEQGKRIFRDDDGRAYNAARC